MTELLRDLPDADWNLLLAPTQRWDVLDAACACHGKMAPRISDDKFWRYLDDGYGYTALGRTWDAIAKAFDAGKILSDATAGDISADKLAGVKNLNKCSLIQWAVAQGYPIPKFVIEHVGAEAPTKMVTLAEGARILADRAGRHTREIPQAKLEYWLKEMSRACTRFTKNPQSDSALKHIVIKGKRRVAEPDLLAWHVKRREHFVDRPLDEAQRMTSKRQSH